jgi:hypothetical protein
VYAPIYKSMSDVHANDALSSSSQKQLANFDLPNDRIHFMGKARIFYRQPADKWMPRYKTVQLSNLYLPFWQVRNEGLSYEEKFSLLAIGGIDAEVRKNLNANP